MPTPNIKRVNPKEVLPSIDLSTQLYVQNCHLSHPNKLKSILKLNNNHKENAKIKNIELRM